MSNTEAPRSGAEGPAPVDGDSLATGTTLARNKLGVAAVVCLVVSAVAPLSTLVGGSPVAFAVHGGSTPASFLIAGLIYGLFSAGYVAMSRHMVNAGGFVAYVARAFGPKAATATAGITLLFYLSSLIAFWAISGVVAAGTFGLSVSAQLVTLVGVVLVAALGYLGVGISVRVLMVLLALEVVALLVFDVGILLKGGPDGFSLTGFSPAAVLGSGFGVSVLLCMVCFSGLEATVVFSEEAHEPRRTIPRAVYISLAVIGLFYTVTSWLITVRIGPDGTQAKAAADPSSFFFAVAQDTMGSGYTKLLEYLVITSFLALFVGFQSMVTRYVFALGRAGVLPAVLGRTDVKRRNPVVASLSVSALILVALVAFGLAGADPITVTYSWLVGLGTVGLLTVLSVVSVSVIAFFVRTGLETNPWTTKVAPALAVVALVTVLIIGIGNYTFLGAQDDKARLLLLLIPAIAVAGWALAAHRERKGLPMDYAADLEV